MGQKVNPISFRIGVNRNWDSRWFDLKNYATLLLEDHALREAITMHLKKAYVSRIEIERSSGEVKIIIKAARPGMVIGRGGQGLEDLQKKLKPITKDQKVHLDVVEVRSPEADAAVVAQNIADQIERRFPFRRAISGALEAAKRANVKGIKILVAGRLNGADIARREKFSHGSVPAHTIKSNIDYALAEAQTTYGTIGIKVWIHKSGQSEFLNTEKDVTA